MPQSVPLFATAALIAAAIACGRQATAPTSPSAAASLDDAAAAADGSTLKVTAPAPISPVNDQLLNDVPTLTASTSTPKFGGSVALQYRFEVINSAGAKVVDSGLLATPSYRVTAELQFKQRYTWRVRAEASAGVGPWSAPASFITSEGGVIRGNMVFDPIYNGATVGQIIGPVTFLPNKGVRLETGSSYIQYQIPQTLTAGEFSMEVEGLRSNAPGDKTKVFSMSSNAPDFIVNPYRVDIQYRGTGGFPPNAITYRVLYGSATSLSLRYEPDTNTRLNSVVEMSPTQTYFWKYTWSTSEVRVVVREGGAKDNGRILYNVGVPVTRGIYDPSPHMAFLGAPTGRSGAESATIAGSIYRNVYIGPGPRP